MSALTEQIGREHRSWAGGEECSCGEKMPMRECGRQSERSPHAEHIAAVTEAAVRAAVAADIEDLEHTSQQVREGVRRGHTVDYYEGYEQAIVHAARIAEGKQ